MRNVSVALLAALAFCPFAATNAEAQQARSFDELQLFAKPGDRITLTDVQGKVSRGTVVRLTDTALLLKTMNSTQEFSETDVREVRQKLRDSLKNGWLIGGAIGAGLGTAVSVRNCSRLGWCGSAEVAMVGIYSGLGMLIGTAVDASIQKTSVVFQHRDRGSLTHISLAPVFGKGRKGLSICVSF